MAAKISVAMFFIGIIFKLNGLKKGDAFHLCFRVHH
jgi:hypothetical protein